MQSKVTGTVLLVATVKNKQSLKKGKNKKRGGRKLTRLYKLILLPFRCQKVFRDSGAIDVMSNMKEN